MGEEFAGSEKLSLGLKGQQNSWGNFGAKVLQQVLYYVRLAAEPSLRNPKSSAEFWWGGGNLDLSFEAQLFFIPSEPRSHSHGRLFQLPGAPLVARPC